MTYQHRYRLPSTMGGAEYSGVVEGHDVLLDIPGTGTVRLPLLVVTPVIPEEPEEWSFVAVLRTEDDRPPWVWVRLPREAEEAGGVPCWWSYDHGRWCTWEEVYSLGTPRLLTFGGKVLRQAGVRAYCNACRETRPVRTDGKFKLHGSRHGRCRGSQQRPVNVKGDH